MAAADTPVTIRMAFTALAGAVFNPWQAFQALAQSAGQFWISLTGFIRPDRVEAVYGLRLPMEGNWLVVNGGVTKPHSHSWNVLAQRFAYDFAVRVGADATHSGLGTRVTDYPAYGRPIVAPADGVVHAVVDNIPDHARPGSGAVDWRARDIRGNHVLIKHSERVYSLCGHLQPRSIPVREGEAVQRGDLIGRCGNSGHSTEPHLHFHVQDRPNFYLSAGVPAFFARVAKSTAGALRIAENEPLQKGDEVSDAGTASGPVAEVMLAPTFTVNDVAFSLWLFVVNTATLCAVWYLIFSLATALFEHLKAS